MNTSKSVARQQLFPTLLDRIEQGYYAAGSWLPAERALAQEFGTDRSAIRRALLQLENRGLIVREAGRRPWVRGETQHRQNTTGSSTGGTTEAELRTVVAILPQHPLYPASLAILHGINATLRSAEAPFRLQVIDTHGGSQRRETALEREALDSVIRENIAGVVLWHMGGADTLPQLTRLERRGTPVVFVDRHPPDFACDFVGCDNRAAIETAMEYLQRMGHRRIAHLTTDEPTTAVRERLDAYTDALLTSGVPPHPDWVFQVSHDDTTDVAPAFDRFFALSEPPTAVIAMNDSLAHHFITECQRRGVDVPQDVSVIGFDDVERHSPRPALLTTLHQPFDKMGRRAAEMVLRRLTGPAPPLEVRQHVLLPAPLVMRSTCRSLEAGPPSVRRFGWSRSIEDGQKETKSQ